MDLLIRTNYDEHDLGEKLADVGDLPPPDHVGVLKLCAGLTGLAAFSQDDVALAAARLTFPAGFRHIRLFDAEDGVEFASQVCTQPGVSSEPLDVAVLVVFSERFETHDWVETRALPAKDPGVLDLLIRFAPGERVPMD